MKTRAMKGRMTYPLMAAVCLVVSLVIGWSPYGQRINHIFYDLYFRQRGPQPPNENIVIVAIDDATLAEYGPLPLDRFKLAEGLRTIEDAHPCSRTQSPAAVVWRCGEPLGASLPGVF